MAELDGTHEDGYAGDVTVHIGDRSVVGSATMRGYFEPVDGRYHWYGRLAVNAELTDLVGTGKETAHVTTAHGSAQCTLGDVDPWGRLRISGLSTPPFPIARSLEDVETADIEA